MRRRVGRIHGWSLVPEVHCIGVAALAGSIAPDGIPFFSFIKSQFLAKRTPSFDKMCQSRPAMRSLPLSTGGARNRDPREHRARLDTDKPLIDKDLRIESEPCAAAGGSAGFAPAWSPAGETDPTPL